MVAVLGKDPHRDLSLPKCPNFPGHDCPRRSWRLDCWESRGRGRKLLAPRELEPRGKRGGLKGAAGARTIRKAERGAGVDGVWAVDGVGGMRWLQKGVDPQSIRLIF